MIRRLSQLIPCSGRSSFVLGFLVCLSVCFFIIYILSPVLGISTTFGGHGHDGYLEIGANIIRGNGFVFERGGASVLHRPPLYPFVISPLTLLPESLQRPALIILQSLMAGFIALLIFRIGKYLFEGSTAGIAVIIFLLNPWLYWNAKNPMTAIIQALLYTLFVFLSGGLVFSGAEFGKVRDNLKRRIGRWSATGITGAGLILSHGAMIAVVMVLLIIILVTGMIRKNRDAVLAPIITGVIIILLVSPWTYRNWLVFGRFVPVTGNAGVAYADGLVHWNICGENARRKGESYDAAALRFAGIDGDESEYIQYWGLKDPKIDAVFNARMKEHIRNHPGVFVKKLVLNSIEYYFPTFTYPFLAIKVFSMGKLAITVFNLLLWILVFVGIYRGRGKLNWRTWTLLGLIVLYGVWYFPFVTFIGHSLYTFGTMPFLSILAAHGLESLNCKGNHRDSQTSAS